MSPEKHYRYESRRYSVCVDPEREIYGVTRPKLECMEFLTVSETPKGYWISYLPGITKDRWVSKASRKRYAHPSKEEALEAYMQRKKAFVRHARARLKRAEEDLALVDKSRVTELEEMLS